MFQSKPTRPPCSRCLRRVGLVALALLAALLIPARGQDFLKKSLLVPGDPKPIYLNADAIATWAESAPSPLPQNDERGAMKDKQGTRVFLLRGNVYIEQGLIKLSMPESVVWVDETGKKGTGIYTLQVYGEDNVLVMEGGKQTVAGRILLNLATRGELHFNCRSNKTLYQALPQDPVFLRAQEERRIARSASPPEVKRAFAPIGLPPSLQQVSQKITAGPAGSPSPVPPPLPVTSSGNGPKVPEAAGPRSQPPPLMPSPMPNPALPAGTQAPAPLPSPLPGPSPTSVTSNSSPGPPVPPAPKPIQAPNPEVQLASLPTTTANAPPVPGTAVQGPPPTVLGGPAPGGALSAPTLPAPTPPSLPGPTAPSPGSAPPAPVMPPPMTQERVLRQLNIRPRSSEDKIQLRTFSTPGGETAWVVTSGVILTVSDPTGKMRLVDIEADRLVFWTKDSSANIINNMQGGGETKSSRSMEFYLAGHVEIRNQTKTETQVLRADEVYYDVGRNVAVALKADLEVQQKRLPNPMHVKSDVLNQLNPKLRETGRTVVYSSSLPSDPGLKIVVSESSLEDIDTPRRNLFGRVITDPITGQPAKDTTRIFRGRNLLLEVNDIPIFYFPYIQTDPDDPLGPLDNVGFNWSQRVLGFQVFTTWNIYDLIGITPLPGTRAQLYADYMSLRGPAGGAHFIYGGKDLLPGLPGLYQGDVKAYGILDKRFDVIGGQRGTENIIAPGNVVPQDHPLARGWFFDKLNVLDLPYGFAAQGNVSLISDKNFLEQYFNQVWLNGPNQDSYLYLRQQANNQLEWSILGQDRLNREWLTSTNWLPRGDLYLGSHKLFNLLTVNAHASAGLYQLLPTSQPTFAVLPSQVNVSGGRFDLWHDVSLPFNLGAFKVVPYLVGDLGYYTADSGVSVLGSGVGAGTTAGTRNGLGRAYGGGGLRVSLPLSRLYPTVQSDLFNLDGLYHKIVISANYYNVTSNVQFNQLPLLDPLNDDATDQALRNITQQQTILNPNNAALLVMPGNFPVAGVGGTIPGFLTPINLMNPQFYALRRLMDYSTDTLQAMDVVQADIRQRWQTKRGFPGNQHVIDWMTLDLSASIFPQSNRDNFGATFGILQYDWVWNIGDSTSLVSAGWLDPFPGGAHVFNVGGNLIRPDRTNLYLGYRQIDPLNSKAVVANATYPFSGKYALAASTLYDFGVNNQINSIAITRIGTDLSVSFGFSYNSIVNSFGVNFSIVPNLLTGLMGGAGGTGASGMGGMSGMGSTNANR